MGRPPVRGHCSGGGPGTLPDHHSPFCSVPQPGGRDRSGTVAGANGATLSQPHSERLPLSEGSPESWEQSWYGAGLGLGGVVRPGQFAENPGASVRLTPCARTPDCPLSDSLNHTSFLSALGPCQTLSCLRAFAHAASSAQNALFASSVLLLLLRPWDDCFGLVALCSESCCGSPLPPAFSLFPGPTSLLFGV